MKVVIGEKYYKETEYGAEILRVLTDSNPNMIKCSVNNSLSRIKISPERLAKEYIKITPHATIAFSIAKVGELEDVIIMVHRKEDIEHKKTFPYIVCRQCITDLFANTINPNYNNLITGFCVSEESLPEKVPMETILACDGMIESEMIAVYMNDNLQDILKMVKPKKYDTALYNLFVDHIRYKYKDKQKDYLSRDIVDGYSRTLKGLMQDNEFMYEFNRGFGIYPLTIDVSREELEKNSLSPYNTMVLSNVLLRWDWGVSSNFSINTPCIDILMQRLPVTISINVIEVLVSVPLGIGFGVICALKKNSIFDNVSQVVIIALIAIPSFVLISYLILIAYNSNGVIPPFWPKSTDPLGYRVAGYIIPVTALSIGSIAGYARFVRAELCEVLSSEYLLLARTKGLTRGQAILRHAFRNSMVPVLPAVIAEFIAILGGSMILENLYQIPGIGRLYIAAFQQRDYNLLMTDMAFYTIIGLMASIVVDLSYGFIDPRIRMGAKK